MPSTSNPSFDKSTTAIEVAGLFPDSIKGRTILITGVNKAGLGYATAEAFASQSPRCLILAGRSQAKLQDCVDALRSKYPSVEIIRWLVVDLGSFKSVRNAGDEVLDWQDVPEFHIVVNNAGVMRHGEKSDKPVPKSEDGIEDMFAVNHLGHFLLTNLIMSKIIAGARDKTHISRIINISSSGMWLSGFRPSDLAWEKSAADLPQNERPNFDMMRYAGMKVDEDVAYIPTAAYCHSKTCNVLFTVGLNQRLFQKYGILSLSLNPGEIKTELQRHTDPDWLSRAMKRREEMGIHDMKTPQQGASTTLVAACDPKLDSPGEDGSAQVLQDCQLMAKAPPHAVDPAAAERLWRISEEMTEIGIFREWVM